MPLFNGEDPRGWVFRADWYFAINEVEEEERAIAALVCMEGRALGWFQWADAQEPFRTWRELRMAILWHFERAGEGEPVEQLMGLRQRGSVADYRDAFEVTAAQMRGVSDAIFKGAFLHGLRKDIRAKLKMHRPNNLHEMMDLAQNVEIRNETVDMVRRNKWGQTLKFDFGARGWGPSEGPKLTATNFESTLRSKLGIEPKEG